MVVSVLVCSHSLRFGNRFNKCEQSLHRLQKFKEVTVVREVIDMYRDKIGIQRLQK